VADDADGGTPPTSREDRQRWRALPKDRRRQLESGRASPADDDEAVALAGRARYLQGWRGAVEWLAAGAIGALLAAVLTAGLWQQPVDLGFVLMFVVVWAVVGLVLRRRRGDALERTLAAAGRSDDAVRGGHPADRPSDDPADPPEDFGPDRPRG
jgi:Flp pilus assembly protein TadB